MIPLPTITEAEILFRSLDNKARIERLGRAVLGRGVFVAEYHLTPREFLVMCVADWLTTMTPLNELEQTLLLNELKHPMLFLQADSLAEVKEGGKLPAMQLGLAEYYYAAWPGEERWWDVRNATWLPQLPRPAVFTMALDVNTLWFMSLKQLEQIRKVRNTDNVNRTDDAAKAQEHAGE